MSLATLVVAPPLPAAPGQRRRIVHVTDSYLPALGGVEVLVHDLATRQAAAGHDVTIITASAPLTQRQEAQSAPGPTVMRLPGTAVGPGCKVGKPLAAGRILELLADAAVVHAHVSVVSPLALSAATAASRAGIPVVVTVHSMWNDVWVGLRLLLAASGIGRLPIVWTAVSTAAAGPLSRALGGDVPVLVVPNAIDVSEWRRPAPPAPNDVITIVSVMRLTRRKRAIPLLRILRQARALVPVETSLRAIVIGDGSQRAAMDGYLWRHRMHDWVDLPGRLTHHQIADLYADAHVFLAPAALESFGIAALEARGAGLAVVANSRTGLADFVSDGQNGLLARDDEGLALAVAELATDPRLLGGIRAHNRLTAPGHDWANMQECLETAYCAAETVRVRR